MAWHWLSYYAAGHWSQWFDRIESLHQHAEESTRAVLSSALPQPPAAVRSVADDARTQRSRWN
jgi:hypothetical protein